MSQIFTVDYTYRSDTTLQDEHRPAHLAYLGERLDAGQLVLSGPWGPGEQPGGFLVYRVADRAEIERVVAEDPFTVHGVAVETRIRRWLPMSGPLSASFPDDEKTFDTGR